LALSTNQPINQSINQSINPSFLDELNITRIRYIILTVVCYTYIYYWHYIILTVVCYTYIYCYFESIIVFRSILIVTQPAVQSINPSFLDELNITRIRRIKDGKLYNILHEQNKLTHNSSCRQKCCPVLGLRGELLLTVHQMYIFVYK
jgi:hypothetical protein